ncbi:MAG: ferredoxin [Acidimicrobiia bacterium]
MKVTVDAEICTGHGRCYALAPDVYAPDEFGHCEIAGTSDGAVPESLHRAARLGRDNCPESAISIED